MSVELVMPFNHPILCCPLLLLPSILPATGSFPVNQFFTSGGQSIGVSASVSVLPMNIQDWFPLELTGLISCSPRDSQQSFPTPEFESINSLVLSFLYSPTLISIREKVKWWPDYRKISISVIYVLKIMLKYNIHNCFILMNWILLL